MESTPRHIIDKLRDFREEHLKRLDLSGWGVEGEVSLGMDENHIYLREIPSEVFELERLEALYLGRNLLTSVPESIAALQNLRSLDLAANQLSFLPNSVSQLRSLTHLHLGRNQFVSVPDSIADLQTLTELDLSGNQLTALPDSISRLENLTGLYLSLNQLTSVPDTISHLKKLTSLDLSGNQLTTLPESISQLQNLSVLYLSDNQLTSLPPSISQLKNLKVLDLSGNPIETPPPEVIRQGVEAIRNYFKQLEAQGKDHLHEAKLLIVGEGGAGKTTLARKIEDQNCELQDEDSTKGIEIRRWAFPMEDGKPFRVSIWDFGGQEIYHATHQFFLTKRSLYVLVADTRKEDTDFYYWLKVVELLSDNSPLLIVKNEREDRSREINDNQLRGQFSNLKESLATNLSTNWGLPQVLSKIKHYISNLPHIGTPLPTTWVKVRETLEEDPRDYISFDEYLEICYANGFVELKDKLQLSAYLHDLGFCLHFQDDPLLKKTLILNPKWGTDAVYKVLDNRRVIANFGRFGHSDLADIWKGAEYTDMQDELLQLMINFKLCYRIVNSEFYIAPQLLTENQPHYEWDETDNLILRYRYDSFMPKGILTQFIVAMHRMIAEQKYVWRRGVILESGHAKAEVAEHYAERETRIRVVGRQRRELFTIVAYELDKIHESYRRLKYDKLIPCNCKFCKGTQFPHFYSFVDIQRFLNDGQQTIQCLKGYAMVDVEGLLRGISHARDKVFISYSKHDREWLDRLEVTLKPLVRNKKISVWADTKIEPGAKRRTEIQRALAGANIAVLLVSPNFLASDFIADNELLPLLSAAEKEGLTILWVPISHSLYKETEIGYYQAATDPAKPLDSLTEPELNKVLVDICEKIREAASRWDIH